MHVVWKRPDGYLGAAPEDFHAVDVGSEARLWLHKADQDAYPFRVSGGWEEDDASVKLNNLVNLIGCDSSRWLQHLRASYSHTMKDDKATFIKAMVVWLEDLKQHIKGDSWEVDILGQVLDAAIVNIKNVEAEFLA